MQRKQLYLVFPLLLLPLLLTACGGGGSGGDLDSSSGTSSGILVDPYIVGAQLEEVTADEQRIIQRSARSVTSATGRFTFPEAFSEGSIIRIKSSSRGQHANAPYAGIMKRQFSAGDTGPLVVSPLTTLVANGMTPASVIQRLNSAGLTGLTEDDLFSDPMSTLNSKTGTVRASDLTILQANMAANTFMEANQNFDIADTATSPVSFADCATIVKNALSVARYQEMVTNLGADFTVGDLAQTAAIVLGTVVDDIQQAIESGNQNISTATVNQYLNGAVANVATIAENFYQTRTGNNGGGGSTPPVDAANGETIFTAACSDCHSVGTSTSTMNLANDGAKVATKFSNSTHRGNSLSTTEIADVAAYLNNPNGGSTSPPDSGTGTPPTGSELYGTECQGCHGTLQASDIIDRTATGTETAIANVNDMSGIILNAEEIQLIADALAAETPPVVTPPAVERTGQQVFDQECQNCHALGTHDTTGTNGDLAGLGTTIVPKIQSGHKNKDLAMTQAELTALANFADTFDPPATGGGACDSCHGQPPSGSSFPNTAGAHAVHTALAGVGTDCDNCHTGAAHNDWVDLGFPAKWDAESGVATDNGDGTCSNIICHGGERTPNWSTGSINVNTQCGSCHASGRSQYNSYSSGDHSDHNGEVSCTSCHDADKLANGGHFSGLNTTTFEQDPATSLKSSLSYNASTRRCQSCHGSATW